MKCPLCDKELKTDSPVTSNFNINRIECVRCGTYDIDAIAILSMNSINSNVRDNLYLLSAMTRLATENEQPTVRVSRETIGDYLEFQRQVANWGPIPSSVEDKGDAVLKYYAGKSKHPGAIVPYIYDGDCPVAFCRNSKEFKFYIDHLMELNLLKYHGGHHPGEQKYFVIVTPLGWERIETLKVPNIESKQTFVAMSFAPEYDDVFKEGILPVEKETGFKMFRIDKDPHNQKICDKIILEIRRSRFLVAEVTGQNPGVYYEAGYAQAFGIPVIWVCRQKELDEKKVHFDTRQYSHVTWTDHANLKKNLTERIQATIIRKA